MGHGDEFAVSGDCESSNISSKQNSGLYSSANPGVCTSMHRGIKRTNMLALLGLLKLRQAPCNRPLQRSRMQKNVFQIEVLREVFKLTRFPSKESRDDISLLLSHSSRGIQIWFQNERKKKMESRIRIIESKERRGLPLDLMCLISIFERCVAGIDKKLWLSIIE